MELISVIVNVFNGEMFINKCINSIVNQTYKNIEILIINDGSTDNTLKICKSIKDKRIRIISTSNLGLSLSRNVGIDNAKGNYLYFVDVDDFIEKDTIEYLYNLCKKYHSDFSTCKPLTIFDYNYKKEEEPEKIKVLTSKEMLKKVILSEDAAVTLWNKLIRKEVFDGVRFQDRIINDIVVTYKLAMKSNKVVYSNQKKYLYLKHKNAVTVNKKGERTERVEDYYKAIMERYYDIKKVYPNMIENEIALLRGMLQLYILDNEDLHIFLKEQEFEKLFKNTFRFKMMFANVRRKEKIKLLLFRINPKLYQKVGNIYRNIKYSKKIK